MSVYICIYIYIYTYTHTCIHICIHIYILCSWWPLSSRNLRRPSSPLTEPSSSPVTIVIRVIVIVITISIIAITITIITITTKYYYQLLSLSITIIIFIIMFIRRAWSPPRRGCGGGPRPRSAGWCPGRTPSPPTKSLGFEGFESSRLLIIRGGKLSCPYNLIL